MLWPSGHRASLEHFKDINQEILLKKHVQYLNPTGKVIVIVPASFHWNNIRCKMLGERKIYGWQKPMSLSKVESLMKGVNLTVEIIERFCTTYGIFHFPGCRYLHRFIEFPILSYSRLDSLFGGLVLAIGTVHNEEPINSTKLF